MELATLEELKGYLRTTRNDRDDVLTRILQGAAGFIQEASGRQLIPDPEPDLDGDGIDQAEPVTKTFSTYGLSIARIADVREVEEVKLAGVAVPLRGLDDASGYTLMGSAPYRRISLGGVTYPLNPVNDLTIKGRFGFYPTPVTVRDGVLELAARIYNERNAGFSDASGDVEGGRLDYFWKIAPPRVLALIDDLRPIDHEVTL